MKTTKGILGFEEIRIDKLIKLICTMMFLLATCLFVSALTGCGKSDDPQNPNPITGEGSAVMGSVKDEGGNPYPNTGVTFLKGSDKVEMQTDASGIFEGKTKELGTYSATLTPPLSTEVVTNIPASVNVQANQTATVDFVIKSIPAKAYVNFGNVQLLEEIVDKDGNTPTNSNELLFAKNIFDEPLGQLNEIKAPDGHQITLSEFQTANGSLLVHCNGNSSTIEISLDGMIPNGTYTFWLAYLNKKRKVSENIDFANDFVNINNPPIGPSDGSGNVVVANINGKIETTLTHGSCILTDEAALVIPILYHINGTTFGSGHVPDAEEMVQMLVYFQ